MKYNTSPLGDAIELVIDHRGLTPKKLGGDWSDYGYRALSAKNIKTGKIVQKETIRYVNPQMYKKWMQEEVERNDIFVTSEAPFGEIYLWDSDEKIVLSQRIFGLRIKKTFDPFYMFYYMCTNAFQGELSARASGTTVTGLRQPELLKCLIRYPDLSTQKRIGDILRSIDKKIQTNNEINDNLLQQVFTLFDNQFSDITAGSCSVSDYILPKRGRGLLSKDAIKGDVPVVAGGLEPATYHNAANTASPVITISASGANAGFVRLWNIPVWSSDSSFIDSSITDFVYFWFVLLKKRQDEIYSSQTGSAQPHIYPQNIGSLPICELDMSEVKQYNDLVTPLFIKIGANESENLKLAHLRDTLLPKLMAGEIDLDSLNV